MCLKIKDPLRNRTFGLLNPDNSPGSANLMFSRLSETVLCLVTKPIFAGYVINFIG